MVGEKYLRMLIEFIDERNEDKAKNNPLLFGINLVISI